MEYDLKHITDFIFKSKERYNELSDEDKKKFFFIVNRKFARMYPKQAQFFNKKGIDESSALDIWYYFFVKKRIINIPQWYWFKLSGKTKKKTTKKEEYEFLTEFYNLRNEDVEFLEEYYPDELKDELKKLKKYNK